MRNRRRFTITVGAVLMVCMLITGYAAVAAEYGSAEDPLITQSYLEQVLAPSLTSAAENTAKNASEHISVHDGAQDRGDESGTRQQNRFSGG